MQKVNATRLAEKAESEIKKYNILEKAFNKIYKAESTVYDKRKDCFLSISNIPESDNGRLRDIYKEFSSQMIELEEYRKRQLSKISEKILPTTAFYHQRAKQTKQSIGNYSDQVKVKEKRDLENAKMRADLQIEKGNALDQVNARNQQSIMTNGEALERDFLEFEINRLRDNKLLFLHFIHSELAYHANALEKLSNLYKTILDIRPIDELEAFVQTYQLNSVVGNWKDFGYKKQKPNKANKMQDEKENSGMIQKNPQIYNDNLSENPRGIINNNSQQKKRVFDEYDDI